MSQINIGAISEALNNKADDVSVVHKEYDETITSEKIFSATASAPTPSSATDNSTNNKPIDKTPEECLKEHLEKFSWLWEDDSPYPWENKAKTQVIKNEQKVR